MIFVIILVPVFIFNSEESDSMLNIFFVSNIDVTKDSFELVFLKMFTNKFCLLQIDGKVLQITVKNYDAKRTNPIPIDPENNEYSIIKSETETFKSNFCEKDGFVCTDKEPTIDIYTDYIIRFDRPLKINSSWPNVGLTSNGCPYEPFRSDDPLDLNYKDLVELTEKFDLNIKNKENETVVGKKNMKKLSILKFVLFLLLVKLVVTGVAVFIYYSKK